MLTPYGIRAKKWLGQNFLKENNICNSIINQASITKKDILLEIGPGLGALTIPAAKIAKKIFAIEKDPELTKILKTQLLSSKTTNVELITNDVMNTNFSSIYKSAGQSLILLGNLPYNISTKVIIKTIQNRNLFSRAIFMLQKEVAERICSKPNSRNYGRLSIITQYCAETRNLLRVKPSSFHPKPKVESSILELLFLKQPKFIAKSEFLLSSVVKAAFSKRRKTIKNSLIGSHLKIDTKTCKKILSSARVDPTRRAETLSVEEFVSLSNCFYRVN